MMAIHALLIICLSMIRAYSFSSSGQNFSNVMKKAKFKLLLWQKSLLNASCADAAAAINLHTLTIHQEIAILARQIEDSAQIHPFNCFALSFSSQVSGFSVLLTFAIVLFQFKSGELDIEKVGGKYNGTAVL